LKDAEPYFSGYSSVVVSAKVAPRKSVDGFVDAFRDNMAYLVRESAVAVNADLDTCIAVQGCGGRVLVVQFTEGGYRDNIVERITLGDRLRGELAFIDLGTGEILGTKSIEVQKDYEGLMQGIRGAVSYTMLRSFPQASGDATEQAVTAINNIEPIAPRHRAMFKRS